MQESHTPVTSLADGRRAPLHDDIAQCAWELWVQYGRPADRDLAIWLEAEQRLHSAIQTSHGKDPRLTSPSALPPAIPASDTDHYETFAIEHPTLQVYACADPAP